MFLVANAVTILPSSTLRIRPNAADRSARAPVRKTRTTRRNTFRRIERAFRPLLETTRGPRSAPGPSHLHSVSLRTARQRPWRSSTEQSFDPHGSRRGVWLDRRLLPRTSFSSSALSGSRGRTLEDTLRFTTKAPLRRGYIRFGSRMPELHTIRRSCRRARPHVRPLAGLRRERHHVAGPL